MLRLCLAPACRRVAASGSYCPAHVGVGEARRREYWAKARRSDSSSASHRFYLSPQWQARRSAHLAAYPACAICGTTERLEVHHLIPHRGDWAVFMASPLQTLCSRHHAAATGREGRRR